jgi:hypothetical protein
MDFDSWISWVISGLGVWIGEVQHRSSAPCFDRQLMGERGGSKSEL